MAYRRVPRMVLKKRRYTTRRKYYKRRSKFTRRSRNIPFRKIGGRRIRGRKIPSLTSGKPKVLRYRSPHFKLAIPAIIQKKYNFGFSTVNVLSDTNWTTRVQEAAQGFSQVKVKKVTYFIFNPTAGNYYSTPDTELAEIIYCHDDKANSKFMSWNDISLTSNYKLHRFRNSNALKISFVPKWGDQHFWVNSALTPWTTGSVESNLKTRWFNKDYFLYDHTKDTYNPPAPLFPASETHIKASFTNTSTTAWGMEYFYTVDLEFRGVETYGNYEDSGSQIQIEPATLPSPAPMGIDSIPVNSDQEPRTQMTIRDGILGPIDDYKT